MVGMTNYTSMFFNPSRRTAFDYFRQGQEARQQFEQHQQNLKVNQQLMDARKQQMDHLAEMNPLLLQAKQGEITYNQALIDAQNQAMEQAAQLQPFKTREAEAAAGLAELQLTQEPERFQAGQDFVRAQIEQQEAGTRNYNQQIRQRQQEAIAAKQAQEQAQAQQRIMLGAAAVNQYEEMAKTNQEAAEQFKKESLSMFGIDEEDFNPEIIKAKARVIQSMAPGEFEQVKGMPGVSFNNKTGTFNTSPEKMMEHIERAEASESLFDGGKIRDVTNDLRSDTKVARESYAAAQKLLKLGEKATPTDQIAAMYSFIKSLDPGGVVTDREGGMLATSEGAFQGIVNLYNKAVGEGQLGNLMPEIQRTAINMANSQIESTMRDVNSVLDIYEKNGNITSDQRRNFLGLVPNQIEYSRDDTKTSNRQEIPGGSKRIKLTEDDLRSLR